MVTGQIDWGVLDQLTDLILAASGHATAPNGSHQDIAQPPAGDHPRGTCTVCGTHHGQDARSGPGRRVRLTAPPLPAGALDPATRERLQNTLLHWSTDLLSGPRGLAAHLRTQLFPRPFSSPSQPLDLGRSTRTVPPHLRQAVILRDRHCQFPGCHQPPSVCEAHHLIPWSQGGPTSLANLRLLCRFHHLIVIHVWRWTLTCHPDGTTTATSPDGRVLHSHGPPSQRA